MKEFGNLTALVKTNITETITYVRQKYTETPDPTIEILQVLK